MIICNIKTVAILRILLFSTLLCLSNSSKAQNFKIQNFVNQIIAIEIPENFEHYYLLSESLKDPEILDSIVTFDLIELRRSDKDFPLKLIYTAPSEIINWQDYDLNTARFIKTNNYSHHSPSTHKKAQFVKFNIEVDRYNYLLKNSDRNTLVVRKKWFWNKSKYWKNSEFQREIESAWKIDKQINPEKTIYYQLSKPTFSADKKYARISIFKWKRCGGDGYTALYKNKNGFWKKIIEYKHLASKVVTSHINCEDVPIYLLPIN